MTDKTRLDEAVQRLTLALDAFETALSRRRANEDVIREMEEDIHLLGMDRARLARDLDDMKARTAELKTVNVEVARRLDAAIGTVRDVLISNGN